MQSESVLVFVFKSGLTFAVLAFQLLHTVSLVSARRREELQGQSNLQGKLLIASDLDLVWLLASHAFNVFDQERSWTFAKMFALVLVTFAIYRVSTCFKFQPSNSFVYLVYALFMPCLCSSNEFEVQGHGQACAECHQARIRMSHGEEKPNKYSESTE